MRVPGGMAGLSDPGGVFDDDSSPAHRLRVIAVQIEATIEAGEISGPGARFFEALPRVLLDIAGDVGVLGG